MAVWHRMKHMNFKLPNTHQWITCGFNSSDNPYNYGDGSRNTVENGYTTIYYNNTILGSRGQDVNYGNCYLNVPVPSTVLVAGQTTDSITTNNIYSTGYYSSNGTVCSNGLTIAASSFGNNTFTHTALNGEYTVCYYFHGATWVCGAGIKNFKITINGVNYTLQEAVQSNYIKPLVLTYSGNTGLAAGWTAASRSHNTVLNVYTGGISVGTKAYNTSTSMGTGYTRGNGAYASFYIWIMTNPGCILTGANFDAFWEKWQNYSGYNYGDGLQISYAPTDEMRFTVASY